MTEKITARQQAKAIFRPDGHLYWRLTRDIKNSEVFPDSNSLGVNLNKKYYLNIDTPADFEYAEYIIAECDD